MSFSGPIRTEWLSDGELMQVLETVVYTDPNGREWELLAGTVIDGASIPRFFWSTIGAPYNGRYRIAAAFHDQAYQTLGVNKDQADLMLRDLSFELGCPHWLAETIYTAVRLGGDKAYAEDQYALAVALRRNNP
jgi:hypothetical protein